MPNPLDRRELGNAKLFSPSLSVPEVVLRLLVQPTLRRGVKRDRQANGHLRADAGVTVQNLRERLTTHSQGFGGIGHGPRGLDDLRLTCRGASSNGPRGARDLP